MAGGLAAAVVVVAAAAVALVAGALEAVAVAARELVAPVEREPGVVAVAARELVALVEREPVPVVPVALVARELPAVAVVPVAVRELPAMVPVGGTVGAIPMPVHTVSLTRTGWARRSNGARIGLVTAGFVTVLFIRSANARPVLDGICGDTRRPRLSTTRFIKLSGRSSNRTNQCGQYCRITNLCSRLGREAHWPRVAREMMMRLPAYR
ncbi:hypothetical protein [Bradyrhizobium sp. WSM1743]|uniref:hypothetical protein n=1 Tax=Bradyrhizobium sp. WSM1743 TaxID=318996 RepID=UPI0012EB381F|nr:hypothetical protein [Bradyrhizobium sp. WSM1743]